ncbi:MAG: sugar phosphate nucleotidyltransferase [Odoribacter sp.]|nr:sugar phosphate nucleotidyltransferase [Odoribacter sp.]
MKGLILAAGIGSRLKPWTDTHPKALVEVGGKPVVEWVIDKFLANGIDHIIINVHHFASQIVERVRRDYPHASIEFSDESDLLLNTGGALRKVLPMLGREEVLVHNADILTDFNLHELVNNHMLHSCDSTLLVQPRDTSRYLLFGDNRLRGWTNISTGQVKPPAISGIDTLDHLAFGGVHLVSPSAYGLLEDYAPAGVPFSIIDFYIDNCARLDIGEFLLPDGASWYDVGRPLTLEAARRCPKFCS